MAQTPDPLQESGRFDAMDGQAAHITDCLTPSFGRDQSSRHEFAQCVGDLEQVLVRSLYLMSSKIFNIGM